MCQSIATQWQQWLFYPSGVSLAITSCLTRRSYNAMTTKWRTSDAASNSSLVIKIASRWESQKRQLRCTPLINSPQLCWSSCCGVVSLDIWRPPQLSAQWFLMTCVRGEEEELRNELLITVWRHSHHFLIELAASNRWRTSAWKFPLQSLWLNLIGP